MELIPVLSTIILVATITTFILAIGAYILYKRREKKGEQYTAFRNAPVTAELITPAVPEETTSTSGSRVYERSAERITLSERPIPGQRLKVKDVKLHSRPTVEKSAPDKFLKYTSEGYVSATEDDKRGTLKWR